MRIPKGQHLGLSQSLFVLGRPSEHSVDRDTILSFVESQSHSACKHENHGRSANLNSFQLTLLRLSHIVKTEQKSLSQLCESPGILTGLSSSSEFGMLHFPPGHYCEEDDRRDYYPSGQSLSRKWHMACMLTFGVRTCFIVLSIVWLTRNSNEELDLYWSLHFPWLMTLVLI